MILYHLVANFIVSVLMPRYICKEVELRCSNPGGTFITSPWGFPLPTCTHAIIPGEMKVGK